MEVHIKRTPTKSTLKHMHFRAIRMEVAQVAYEQSCRNFATTKEKFSHYNLQT